MCHEKDHRERRHDPGPTVRALARLPRDPGIITINGRACISSQAVTGAAGVASGVQVGFLEGRISDCSPRLWRSTSDNFYLSVLASHRRLFGAHLRR